MTLILPQRGRVQQAADGGAFTPNDDAGITYWFDPSNGITLSGLNVTNWEDQISTYDAVSAAGERPTIITLNGHDVLEFASKKGFANSSASETLDGTCAFICIFRCDPDTFSDARALFSVDDSTDDFQLDSGATGTNWFARVRTTGLGSIKSNLQHTSSLDDGDWHIVFVEFDSTAGTVELYVDQATTPDDSDSNYDGTLGTQTATEIIIGSNRAETERWDGGIADLIYTTDLSHRADYLAYFEDRYGSFPVTP